MRRACLIAAFTAWIWGGVAVAYTGSTEPFDADWRFLKADASGAERAAFDDAGWRTLDVPHDWSIEGPFDERNATGPAGGFLPAGVGWYRKHFALPTADAGKGVFIDFDGVAANSDVWINGTLLGHRPSGYIGFRYELTDHVTFGDDKPNVLAVRCDNAQQPASRWFAGAGIDRHVRLVVTDPVHLDHWATFVTTPTATAERATIHVQTSVVNQSDAAQAASVRFTILSPDGRAVGSVDSAARGVPAGKSADFGGEVSLAAPLLWGLDHPHLYIAVAHVSTGDEEAVRFGIRAAAFEPATGFHLNGTPIKIKGVCLHGDASAFGTAVPQRAWERRLELLRPLGVNAIRLAHCPADPALLDLCDRMGFLVMDEAFDCWTVGKNPFDYHLYFDRWSKVDVADMVRRDRNHPSVILYSAGNEIHDTPQQALAKRILSGLVQVFHENDPTRPVTQALFRPNVSGDYTDGLADLLDVVGQNYRENEILAAYRQRPTRKIIGTENAHDRSQWIACRDHREYAGQFLWTGVDYLGEAGRWPLIASGAGLLDRTGTARPLAFQRQSWWSDKPMVYGARRVAATATSPTEPGYEPVPTRRHRQALFADWSPRDASPHVEQVEVYSNCEQVELTLNGKSLGTQPKPADDAPRMWTVPFAPGIVKLVGSNGGAPVATHEMRSAGKAARIRLTVDRSPLSADWDDVAYVTAEVTDAYGVVVPTAADAITFGVSGPGVIAAVDSGDNASHEPFQATTRRAYQGTCIALVKANGRGAISVSAAAPGLAGGSLTVESETPPGR